MDNIAALKAAAVASDGKRAVANNAKTSGNDAMFAAFLTNTESAKQQDDRPAPAPTQKADNTDDTAPVAAQPTQLVVHGGGHGGKAKHADDTSDDKTPAKASAATAKAPAAKNNAPVDKTAAQDAKPDNKPADAKQAATDAPVVPQEEEVAAKVATPLIKGKVVVNAKGDDKDDDAKDDDNKDAKADDGSDTQLIAAVVVQAVAAKDDGHQGHSKKNTNDDVAKALAAANNNNAGEAPASPDADADAAAKIAADKQSVKADASASADNGKAADDALDAALLAAIAAAGDSKNLKAADGDTRRAPVTDAKVADLSNLVAGGSQASPLLSGQAIGQNQPVLPQTSFQAGAPSATNLSNGAENARPISGAVGVMAPSDSIKNGEIKLAKLPAGTAQQVQDLVTLKLRYAVKTGEKSVNIQLRPDELGRVDIKLDFKADNTVSAKITADTQTALDILKQDSAGMQKVLNDAGMTLEENGLQFSLRDQGDPQANRRQFGDTLNDNGVDAVKDEGGDDYVAVQSTPASGLAANGRINVVI